jgi:hypothetical protein
MAPFQLTNTQKILHAAICGKSDADAILGSPREHCTSKGTTVTNASYYNLCRNHLKPAIGLLSTSVLLLHDPMPQSAHMATETIRDIRFKCLPHPLYLLTSLLVTTIRGGS